MNLYKMFAQIAGNAICGFRGSEFQNFPGEDAPVPPTNYVAELMR